MSKYNLNIISYKYFQLEVFGFEAINKIVLLVVPPRAWIGQ